MQTISTSISPRAHLSLLNQQEVAMLTDQTQEGLYELVRLMRISGIKFRL